MGLFFRYNLFREVGHEQVYEALADFWSAQGRPIDHYVQEAAEGDWFPGQPTSGRPDLVVAAFPELGLSESLAAQYLAPQPEDLWYVDDHPWDIRVQPHDQYTRGHTLAFQDFWRFLGAGISEVPRDHWTVITPDAPAWREFAVPEQDA
ncbi:hypothetical protein [Streptomyces sp. NPDC060031]|uniref:hypothetical protein n=1 Tax=Streptomyces sp. NPDC060031 TaxID=3347043 RepID=UPI00368CB7F4